MCVCVTCVFVIVSICACVHTYERETDRQTDRQTDRERERQRKTERERDGWTDGQTDGQMRERDRERTLVSTIQLYKLLLWFKVPGKCTVCRGYSS